MSNTCSYLFFSMKNLAEIEELQLYAQLDLIARHVVEGFITGLHRSPYHGFSVEFAEHRHYNTGESIKHIDWKLYGRTEKLFVKRYEEETNLKAHLVLDTSSSMLFPYPTGGLHNKLFFSIYCMAALIRLLTSQRDAVGMHWFSDKLEFQTDARLTGVHRQMLLASLSQLMEDIRTGQASSLLNKPTRAANLLDQLADALPKRSLVIIFSDMMDQHEPEKLFSALQHFRYNQHEVILFHVTDPALEEQFDFPNKPHRFVDMETGQILKMNPVEIRDRYRERVSRHHEEIRLRCGQYDIDLVEAGIRQNFSDVLLPFLIKRKKLF